MFNSSNEKRQWRAFYWDEDRQDYIESFPLTKKIAFMTLEKDDDCHFIRKVEGWFKREIWKNNNDDVSVMTNIVACGDVAGRDIVKTA